VQRLASLLVACLLFASVARAQQQPQTYAQLARTSGTWTSATAVNTALTITTTGFSEALVTFSGTSTLLGGQIVFEADDGSGAFSWSLTGQRADTSGLQEQRVQLGAQNLAWTIPVSGFAQMRVRLTDPLTAGTATIAVAATAASATETSTAALVAAFQQFTSVLAQVPGARSRIAGSFGRQISSTGDALDVNVKFPPTFTDPCLGAAKNTVAISQTASAVLVAKVPGRLYLCSVLVVGADAENLSLVEGSGTTCGTSTLAIIGGTTAATGPNLAANGGFTLGTGGGAVAITSTPGNDVCLLQSGTGRVAGVLTYAVQRAGGVTP
jgi:hypothetical protein